ncbi:NAD(P)H-dependent oxidoreductase [Leptospira ilyithenensis]|uniref:NAD(P)H-dependent oxidoreductase n=1 Tax=Leptospira ilyithenensis TaxID=2484901 RepID=A0A4R9LK33_9LEPT|nr:NAD(P)H-dependent oxidoreductase [Leptospira ilyithenensis]TGN07946.1 NAD(P)H-dependent oxidoreductase [Leptospira ilyithenensis]
MELIEQLQWRYATKRMNGAKVPKDKLDKILEAIQLSPSSMGFQPYTIYVIESPDTKKEISSKASKQPQITESSHLIVFAAWTSPSLENVDRYIELIANERSVTLESLTPFRNKIASELQSKSSEELVNWTAKQAYIALGTGIAAAALERVDATPMEGFDSNSLDEVLGLKEKGLKSVVLLALGYRNQETDPLVSAKKVRRPKEELFVTI